MRINDLSFVMDIHNENLLFFVDGGNLRPDLLLFLALFDTVEVNGDLGKFSLPGLVAQGQLPGLLLVQFVLHTLLNLIGFTNKREKGALHGIFEAPLFQEVLENIKGSLFASSMNGWDRSTDGVLTPFLLSRFQIWTLSTESSLVSDVVHKANEGRLHFALLGFLVFIEGFGDGSVEEVRLDSLDVSCRVNNVPLDFPFFVKLIIFNPFQVVPLLHHKQFSLEVVDIQNGFVSLGQLLSHFILIESILILFRVRIKLGKSLFLDHLLVADHELSLFLNHLKHGLVIGFLFVKMILSHLVHFFSALLVFL